MPTGYLVTLGADNALWFGDGVATSGTSFTTSSTIGAGTIRASGSQAGEAFTNRDLDGTFQTGSDNRLYFVPTSSDVTITGATVVVSPGYNTNLTNGTGGADSLGGNAAPQTIDGLAGDDTITGGSTSNASVLAGGEADIDVLKGGAGNDSLYGQGGWDRLQGGAGNDYLVGGAGTDIADLSDGTAGVNVQLAGGRYSVNLNGAGLGTDSFEGVDGVIGTTFNDTLVGTDGDGEDQDGSVYTNYLDGGAGNDSLDGRTGSDLLFGGTGNDTLIGGLWDGDEGIQFQAGGQSRPFGTIDDRLHGGTGNDVIHGDDSLGTSTQGGNDSIDGGDGDDTIVAGAGDDTVFGGAGIDTITGGAGADSIFGGTGRDTIDAGAGNDTVSGGADADTIQLNGAFGTDSIIGGETTTAGGADFDTLDAGSISTPVNVTFTNEAGTLASGGNTATFSEIENVTTGAGADTVNASANTGAATFTTGAGADTITGGTGSETISAGTGDDVVNAGGGADRVDAGEGNDTVAGGAGADTIAGGEGADTLDGGADNDSLLGGEGNDSLLGGDGLDTLSGGTGDDILDGGAGADTLTGGLGRDTLVAGDGDLVTDFNTGADQANRDFIDLSGFYNDRNLAIWNAANPGQHYATALGWLRADQADGRLDFLSGQNGLPKLDMVLQNAGGAVDASALDQSNTGVVCFGADALILTDRGPVAAGSLQVGDLVMTRDAGLQPIRWIGRRVLDRAGLEAAPNLRPIRIAAGALGKGVPEADLIVSPQHRVLIRSRIAQKMFGAGEVLVAARQLLLVEGIDIATDLEAVTYVHFLFDDHQVVWSNGAETESLHPGRQALSMVGQAAREEIFALFPDLRDADSARPGARPMASGRMGRKLAMRHAQNSKPLVA